jgi:hypothetical protein
MYATTTSEYTGVSYDSQIGHGQSGQYCHQLTHHSRPLNVGTQVSSGHTHQPLTRFQAIIMQKRQPSQPQGTPTVPVLPLQVVASPLSSCHAHGGNLEAPIISFEESRPREQGTIQALGWILVRLPTYLYRDAFLVNAIFPSSFHKDHVFMSINPPNGLELSNVVDRATVDELRENIFPMWPTGVVRQHHDGHDWHVRFAGRPWDPKDHQSTLFVLCNTSICCCTDLSTSYRSQRIICRIFWVLAAQVCTLSGYDSCVDPTEHCVFLIGICVPNIHQYWTRRMSLKQCPWVSSSHHFPVV